MNRSIHEKVKRQTVQLSGMLPVYLIIFFSFFDTHAQMPILAPYASTLGATPFIIGIVVGAYSFFNITGNLTSGIWIDRTNWKLPLFTGLAGVSVILALYPQAGSTTILILIRAAHGYMGGILVPAALACLTNRTNAEGQNKNLAVFGAAIGLAAVTGPVFAGIVANNYGYTTVYYSMAGMMATATIFSYMSLYRQNQLPCSQVKPLISFRLISGKPHIRSAFFYALGTMGSTGTLASFLPTKTAMLDLNPAETGLLFATFALTAIAVQVAWPSFFKALFREDHRGGAVGLLILSFALTLAASAPSARVLFLALVLFGTGFGFSFQGMLGLVISGSDLEWRGRAIGLFFAVYSLGVAAVPPLSGLIWQNISIFFPFYTAAFIALCCMAAGYKIIQVKK
ncbi:MAG: MFS transporter [Dethiobacteria bacterium]